MTGGQTQEAPALDPEAWQALLRSHCGGYNLQRGDCKLFVGTFRPRSVSGLEALDISCNAYRVDRTLTDIRRDEIDRFALFFLTSGRVTLMQNDRTTPVMVGGCALIDTARPVSYVIASALAQCVTLTLPRQTVVSQLGLEPEGNVRWRNDTPAVRLLSRLVLDAPEQCDDSCASAERYMQLAICDLLGAMLASSDLLTYCTHNEKMFRRVTNIVKNNFTDPGIRPRDVANEAGISLRYLQKLFTARGTTCSGFIQSLRVEHAARLVQFMNLTKSGQPLSEIAYACGFQDYAHFTRAFRRKFGRSPSSCTSSSSFRDVS
jgi:AraC-like DNA-binding protein